VPDRREFFIEVLRLSDGHTDETRTAWLIDFAQRLDLDGLAGKDLVRVQTELAAFSRSSDALAGGGSFDTRPGPKALSQLAEEIRNGIRGLLKSERGGWRAPEGPVSRVIYRDPDGTLREYLDVEDTARLALWKAQSLVHQYLDRILKCARCERWFLRIRRQRFCSERCSGSSRKNTWRQNTEHRAEELKRQRERYRITVAKNQGRGHLVQAVRIQKRGETGREQSK